VSFGRWDVTSLWRVELTRSLTNLELPNDLLLRQAMRRLARMYRPKVVIHPCEFQPMERAIWAGLKGTQTRSVAFQHATVSSNTLMYFFAEEEIETALAGKDPLATPLPDYYLTTGDWPLEIMRAAGFPTARSAVVGAVRYNGLRLEQGSNADKTGLRARLGLPIEATLVLVATSSDWEDSLALLDALASAQALLPASFAFLFKCHYHCRVEGEIRRLFSQVDRKRWRIVDVDADLHAHIRASDVVLLTNSTTGLEAMALGCPPVVFDNRAVVNIGPLGDLREAALFAHTPLELAKSLQAALEPTVRARLEAAWPGALSQTFHKLDGQAPARFLAFLEERALL
jgi:surface carbohydrate biosynthesis protein (TIGR04326 family)